MPAWKVIADCSVGSVLCASLVLFVSNQSSKFPALSGVGCVNLHARFLTENYLIYQLFLYLCMSFFSVGEGHFEWVCMNSYRELVFTCSIHHFKLFMDKKINKNLSSFVINFFSLSISLSFCNSIYFSIVLFIILSISPIKLIDRTIFFFFFYFFPKSFKRLFQANI